jgi:hypothetical protein
MQDLIYVTNIINLYWSCITDTVSISTHLCDDISFISDYSSSDDILLIFYKGLTQEYYISYNICKHVLSSLIHESDHNNFL